MKIEEEIQQKQFKNEYLKAHINILFSASWMNQYTTQKLKTFNISWQQFNILRILKGQAPKPSTVKELGNRMIDKMSNASRLIDKLEKKKLVERIASKKDRRKVEISITKTGLEIVEVASQILEDGMVQQMQSLTLKEAEILNELLDKLRI